MVGDQQYWRPSGQNVSGVIVSRDDHGWLSQLELNGRVPSLFSEGGVTVFSCVRNEMLRLPFFFEYYRQLGVERFIFIDNGSTDGTNQYLLDQSDTGVYSTNASYAESRCGVHWLNSVLDLHSLGQWALVVDADELLAFPFSEQVPIRVLTDFLDSERSEAFIAPMLDMYADAPLDDVGYIPGQNLIEACPYFDLDSYSYVDEKGIGPLPHRGGVRQRLFWSGREHRGAPPVLRKIPLVRWSGDMQYEASTHILRRARLSTTTGILLHFKLLGDFKALANQEADRGEHWDGAAQYQAYAEVLEGRDVLNPYYQGSVKYRGSDLLVGLSLMYVSEAYRAWTAPYRTIDT